MWPFHRRHGQRNCTVRSYFYLFAFKHSIVHSESHVYLGYASLLAPKSFGLDEKIDFLKIYLKKKKKKRKHKPYANLMLMNMQNQNKQQGCPNPISFDLFWVLIPIECFLAVIITSSSIMAYDDIPGHSMLREACPKWTIFWDVCPLLNRPLAERNKVQIFNVSRMLITFYTPLIGQKVQLLITSRSNTLWFL